MIDWFFVRLGEASSWAGVASIVAAAESAGLHGASFWGVVVCGSLAVVIREGRA